MHRAAYAALGLDWRYDAVDVAAGELAEFVAGLDESWQGLSVTMPGKVEAAALGVRHDEVMRPRLVENPDSYMEGVEEAESVEILETFLDRIPSMADLGIRPGYAGPSGMAGGRGRAWRRWCSIWTGRWRTPRRI